MVDRRKALHRRACEWSTDHPGSFLDAQIPYASVVEQISVRRTPLPEFAERDPAALAFADLWSEVRVRLEQRVSRPALTAIQSLSVELEYALAREQQAGGPTHSIDVRESVTIHSFDTEHRALTESGHVLELHESTAGMAVVAGRVNGAFAADKDRVEVQIDGSWALQILSGEMSPFVVLERRLGRSGSPLVQEMRAMIGKRRLFRTDSRVASSVLRQHSSKLAFQACG
jgi:hypothetical protein